MERKSKKIVFFTPSLNIGGIERVFMTYANELAKNYNVEYLVCHRDGDLKNFLDKSIVCYNLNIRLAFSLFKLIRYISKNKPDYLITGGDIPNAISLLANKIAFFKTKVIISQHNYLNIEQTNRLNTFFIRFLYKSAFKIIAVSDGISLFLQDYKIKRSKIVTVYNPINVKEILNLSKESDMANSYNDYVLFVGRLSQVKNLEFLIKSFNNLRRRLPGTNLLIVGDGPCRDALEVFVRSLGIEKNVVFTGIISNPYNLIKHASFVVLPSFSEALPTIILESFALGKTVASTPTKGAIDLLRGFAGSYVSKSFDDINEFSELMEAAFKSQIDQKELISYAMKFDISVKIKEIENILN